jgi:hypothetical protein
MFEGENLTNEENDSAIPMKPIFDKSEKLYKFVPNPEDVADLVSHPTMNDVLVSVLSENCTVFGDENHRFVKRETGEEIPVKTLFANMTCVWIDFFNKQIKTLGDLLPSSQISFENRQIEELILKKFPQLSSYEGDLMAIFQHFNAFKNSIALQEGKLTPAELAEIITVDNLALYLINSQLVNNKPENFGELINLVLDNIHYFSPNALKLLLITLINNLYQSSLNTSTSKLTSFDSLIVNPAINPSVISQLDSIMLDKLAFLLTLSRNIDMAKQILEILVLQRSTAPSVETFNAFLLDYEKHETNQTKMIQDLANLKSVFFHRQLSPISFSLLLKSVKDITYFRQFLNLVETNDKENKLFIQFQTVLFEKLHQLQIESTYSNLEKQLQITQLVNRIVTSEDIKLNARTIQLLGELYLEVGNTSNIEVLCQLNK